MLRRLALVTRLVDEQKAVLFVGDDDLASLCLHWLGYRHVTVVDFDQELLHIVSKASRGKVATVAHDLRGVYRRRFPKLGRRFDLFLSDPPYGFDGLRVFAGVGLGALRVGGQGVLVAPSRRAARSSVGDPDALGLELQTFLSQNGALVTDIEPHSQRSFHGTVSSMLVVRRVDGRRVDFGALNGPKDFY
jgi:predicted methyltransferase